MAILASRLFELTANLSGILRDLEEAGIYIEIGDDFAKYRAYRNQHHNRGQMYAMFDITSSFIDRTNGFWVCGFNSTGELVHTQAVRLIDLSGISLAKHLTDHRHKYITPNTTPDPDRTFFEGPRALDTITGKVCYQGDFWVRAAGLGGPRSQGATTLLSRVLLEITFATWSPDYAFALVPKQLAAKGAHLRYGYCHCEPGRWMGPDQQITDEDYLIWMGADDMANFFATAPERLQHRMPDFCRSIPPSLLPMRQGEKMRA
jgi:hypothetical protein